MAKILLIGAGRSSASLYDYLVRYCHEKCHELFILTQEQPAYLKETSERVTLQIGDVFSDGVLERACEEIELVISMLPAHLHIGIATYCVDHQIHFLSASYVSPQMKALDQKAKERGVLLLNECGLDPGLDHMSAMELIHQIKENGAEIIGFESFAGGLVSPKSDDNPWNYKFTWNPRNVVLAGQGGVAKFRESGTYKYIPYNQLFRRTELISIPEFGKFEGYANRDSLKYESLYELDGISTIYRGTLRRPGFCKAWQKLIDLGMTDDSYEMEVDGMTKREFTNLFLAYHPTDRVEIKFQRYLGIAQDDFDIMEKMEYLGLFSQEQLPLKKGTPAQILQSMIEEKWKLKDGDLDMIVMWHKLTYKKDGQTQEVQSSLVVEGSDTFQTAMAKTVGLPLGIAAKLILENAIKARGVQIPVNRLIYKPILEELKARFSIYFSHQHG